MNSILAQLTKEDLYRKWKKDNKRLKQLQKEIDRRKRNDIGKSSNACIPNAAILPLFMNLLQESGEIFEQDLSLRWWQAYSLPYPKDGLIKLMPNDPQGFDIKITPNGRLFKIKRLKTLNQCKSIIQETERINKQLVLKSEEQALCISELKRQLSDLCVEAQNVKIQNTEYEHAINENVKNFTDLELQRENLLKTFRDARASFTDIKNSLKQKLNNAISDLHDLESKGTEFRSILRHNEEELHIRWYKIDALEGKVQALEAKNVKNVSQIKNLKKLRGELGEKVSRLSDELLNSQYEAAQLKQNHDDLQNQLMTAKTLQKELEKDRSSFEEEISSLENQLRRTLTTASNTRSRDSIFSELKDPQTEQSNHYLRTEIERLSALADANQNFFITLAKLNDMTEIKQALVSFANSNKKPNEEQNDIPRMLSFTSEDSARFLDSNRSSFQLEIFTTEAYLESEKSDSIEQPLERKNHLVEEKTKLQRDLALAEALIEKLRGKQLESENLKSEEKDNSNEGCGIIHALQNNNASLKRLLCLEKKKCLLFEQELKNVQHLEVELSVLKNDCVESTITVEGDEEDLSWAVSENVDEPNFILSEKATETVLENWVKNRSDSEVLNRQLLEVKFIHKKPVFNLIYKLQSKLSSESSGKVAAETTVSRLELERQATLKSMTTIRNKASQMKTEMREKEDKLISNLSELKNRYALRESHLNIAKKRLTALEGLSQEFERAKKQNANSKAIKKTKWRSITELYNLMSSMGKERDALQRKTLYVEEENAKLKTEINILKDVSDKESAKVSELEKHIRNLKYGIEMRARANESSQNELQEKLKKLQNFRASTETDLKRATAYICEFQKLYSFEEIGGSPQTLNQILSISLEKSKSCWEISSSVFQDILPYCWNPIAALKISKSITEDISDAAEGKTQLVTSEKYITDFVEQDFSSVERPIRENVFLSEHKHKNSENLLAYLQIDYGIQVSIIPNLTIQSTNLQIEPAVLGECVSEIRLKETLLNIDRANSDWNIWPNYSIKNFNDELMRTKRSLDDEKKKSYLKIYILQEVLRKAKFDLKTSVCQQTALQPAFDELIIGLEKLKVGTSILLFESEQRQQKKNELQARFEQLSRNFVKGIKHLKSVKRKVLDKDESITILKAKLDTALVEKFRQTNPLKKALNVQRARHSTLAKELELKQSENFKLGENLDHLKLKLATSDTKMQNTLEDIKLLQNAKKGALASRDAIQEQLWDIKEQVRTGREMQERVEASKFLMNQKLCGQIELVQNLERKLNKSSSMTKAMLTEVRELKSENQRMTSTYEEQLKNFEKRNDKICKLNQELKVNLQLKPLPEQADGLNDDFLMTIATKQALRENRVNNVVGKNRVLKGKLHKLKIALHSAKKSNKRMKAYAKQFELHNPAYIELQYVKNVIVKFLALAYSFTDEQKTLCAVLATCLNFSERDKFLIDRAYFSKAASAGGLHSTLFPSSITGPHPK